MKGLLPREGGFSLYSQATVFLWVSRLVASGARLLVASVSVIRF
ncbi:hypothetical protein [Gloeocapsopsis dulcis]|nr:hypothetical protein [Gloeocapsopsis dulcis]WNN89737.1 hypothetical protein P0S91_01170 [Gloeocapsopsis dulcis]